METGGRGKGTAGRRGQATRGGAAGGGPRQAAEPGTQRCGVGVGGAPLVVPESTPLRGPGRRMTPRACRVARVRQGGVRAPHRKRGTTSSVGCVSGKPVRVLAKPIDWNNGARRSGGSLKKFAFRLEQAGQGPSERREFPLVERRVPVGVLRRPRESRDDVGQEAHAGRIAAEYRCGRCQTGLERPAQGYRGDGRDRLVGSDGLGGAGAEQGGLLGERFEHRLCPDTCGSGDHRCGDRGAVPDDEGQRCGDDPCVFRVSGHLPSRAVRGRCGAAGGDGGVWSRGCPYFGAVSAIAAVSQVRA